MTSENERTRLTKGTARNCLLERSIFWLFLFCTLVFWFYPWTIRHFWVFVLRRSGRMPCPPRGSVRLCGGIKPRFIWRVPGTPPEHPFSLHALTPKYRYSCNIHIRTVCNLFEESILSFSAIVFTPLKHVGTDNCADRTRYVQIIFFTLKL